MLNYCFGNKPLNFSDAKKINVNFEVTLRHFARKRWRLYGEKLELWFHKF